MTKSTKKSGLAAILDSMPISRVGDAGIYVPNGSQMSDTSDPLAKQRAKAAGSWIHEPEALTTFYETIWICRLIADVISEDSFKNWFEIDFFDANGKVIENDSRSRDLLLRLEELDAKDVLRDFVRDDTVYGDGLIAIGIEGNSEPDQPIEKPQDVQNILYLTTKPRDGDFSEIILDEDIESSSYGLPCAFKCKVGGKDKEVHASRCLHLQSRRRITETTGLSLFVPTYSVIQLLENLTWSSGQAAFNSATRVVSSKELSGDLAMREAFSSEVEGKINSLSALVIGEDEDIKTVSNIPSNMEWLVSFTWDLLAASTRINRTRLLGAQAGKLASASSDTKRHYERIAGFQATHLRKPIRRLIDLLLCTKDFASASTSSTSALGSDEIGRSLSGQRFRVNFLPVETETVGEMAETESKKAEAASKKAAAFAAYVGGIRELMDLGLIADTEARKLLMGEALGEGSLMEELFPGGLE